MASGGSDGFAGLRGVSRGVAGRDPWGDLLFKKSDNFCGIEVVLACVELGVRRASTPLKEQRISL